MKIWAVANQKGGVGKTTTTVTLAGLLTRQGLQVVMLDLDPHGSLTSYFKLDPDGVPASTYSLFETAAAGGRGLPPGLPQPVADGLALIPAAPALATLDRQLGRRQGMGLVVRRALEGLGARYDVAIMDCPPVLGVLMVNALAACERLVIPTQTEFLALKGLERMTRTLDMIMRARRRRVPATIVPTMFDPETWACLEALQNLRQRYGDQVWEGEIPADSQFQEASRAGVPLPWVNPRAPGVQAYAALLRALLWDSGPVACADAAGVG